MRDPTRIPRLLDLLGAFWRANPDLRLGQIVDSAAGNGDVFLMEDVVIEAWLRERTEPTMARRNCWTCGFRVQHFLVDLCAKGGQGASAWLQQQALDARLMPPEHADGCPEWKGKA